MAEKLGKVTLIILTYNSVSKLGALFDKVLQSVMSQNYPNLEVIVADNGSIDGTPAYVEKFCGNVASWKILRLGRNYGWTGGNNRAALRARPTEFILFMNDDVILGRDCVRRLVEALSRDESLAAVQPLIVNRDGSLNCGLQLALSGFPRMVTSLRSRDESKVFCVSGSALLTKADIFFGTGMFDEDLFLYHDDVDYCWRIRLAGYRVACVTSARAYHYGSATLGADSLTYWYFLMRNNVWVLAKNTALSWLPLRLFLMTVEAFISFIGHALLIRRDPRRAFIALKGIIDGLRGLHKAFAKRADIAEIRRMSERELNKLMNVFIDVDLIFPISLRKGLHKALRIIKS